MSANKDNIFKKSVIKSYKDLVVWQKSMLLTNKIYSLTRNFPEVEKYGLSLQMRRCSVSIPSNIAEGWGRNSNKAFAYFLNVARGSLYELQTQVEIAYNLEYIDCMESTSSLIDEIGKMIYSLIQKINNQY